MTNAETFSLTRAMVATGETLDLGDLSDRAFDKHSTGGVGDKVTLALVPILAAGGATIVKMSGRGLGHTGGTLDKLESIPGMRVSLSNEEIVDQARRIGAVVAAQSASLVPADRKLYALRDATGTVASLPLIAASIMSKKLAAGSRRILLDVKVGSGAFMKTLPEARAAAELMIAIGAEYGRRVVAVLTDMNTPLGYSVGNFVEVREVVELLRDNPWAEPRLKKLVRYLAGAGFVMCDRAPDLAGGEALADELIASGRAFDKLVELVESQGGDASCLKKTVKQSLARVRLDVKARSGGYIQAIDAIGIGCAAMRVGAGRLAKEDTVDHGAGIVLRHTVGNKVGAGNVIATVHASSEVSAREAAMELSDCFRIGEEPAPEAPLIYETVGLE
jgi:pyrimidine-nucleoside phosphorylase